MQDMECKFGPGTKLPNGAIVIHTCQPNKSHPEAVVLAEYGYDYVTWVIDHDGNAFWGHYFNNFFEAVADLKKRVEG